MRKRFKKKYFMLKKHNAYINMYIYVLHKKGPNKNFSHLEKPQLNINHYLCELYRLQGILTQHRVS